MPHVEEAAGDHAAAAVGEGRPYQEIRHQLIVLGLFPLSEAIAWTSIFPYIYAMVESLSSEADSDTGDSNTATYAGIMVAVFTFGEFVMAPQWARISDRIGRKPTLLIGLAGAIISALTFGFSISLPMAIAARTFAGLANPNLGILNTFVGELVAKEHQAKGFSVVPTIIGPIVGGYLAEPVKNHPSLFRAGSVWDKFPYLLPNLLVVCCLTTSCVLGTLLLDEVHLEFRGRDDIGRRAYLCIRNAVAGKGWKWNKIPGDYVPVEPTENEMELDSLVGSETGDQDEQKPIRRSWREAFTKQVCFQIASSAILGYIKIAMLATVPIFLGAPPHSTADSNSKVARRFLGMTGGLGLDTQGTSNLLLVQAGASIATQILAVPRIIEKWGPLRSYKVALALLLCLFCVIPFASSFPKGLAIAAIIVDLCIYALLTGVSSTCSSIMITNTAPSPVYLATVNGVATSLGCLARTMGPIVSGPLFHLGVRIGLVGLPFWALGIVTGMGLVVAIFLRNHA